MKICQCVNGHVTQNWSPGCPFLLPANFCPFLYMNWNHYNIKFRKWLRVEKNIVKICQCGNGYVTQHRSPGCLFLLPAKFYHCQDRDKNPTAHYNLGGFHVQFLYLPFVYHRYRRVMKSRLGYLCIHFYCLIWQRQASHREIIQNSELRLKPLKHLKHRTQLHTTILKYFVSLYLIVKVQGKVISKWTIPALKPMQFKHLFSYSNFMSTLLNCFVLEHSDFKTKQLRSVLIKLLVLN